MFRLVMFAAAATLAGKFACTVMSTAGWLEVGWCVGVMAACAALALSDAIHIKQRATWRGLVHLSLLLAVIVGGFLTGYNN